MKFHVTTALQDSAPKLQTFGSYCFIALIICLFLSSCKASKETTKSASKEMNRDSVLVELERSKVQFEWLYAKARVNYEDKSQSKSFTATIRMQKDSIIWISITTIMGVEAARLLIQHDTVYLLDKLNKKYQKGTLSSLENYFPFSFDISLIQELLAGNSMPFEKGNTNVKKEKNGFTIVSENNLYRYTIKLNEDMRISTEHLVDRHNDRKLSLVFDDYKNETGRLFSYARSVTFSGDENISISLKFSKVKWDEAQTFPFHVGERYEE